MTNQRARKPYPSDVTDTQWEILAPLIPEPGACFVIGFYRHPIPTSIRFFFLDSCESGVPAVLHRFRFRSCQIAFSSIPDTQEIRRSCKRARDTRQRCPHIFSQGLKRVEVGLKPIRTQAEV
jgi:hypothetical protein